MNTYIIFKMHCKHQFQIQDLHSICKACPWCSRRLHSVATTSHSMFKIIAPAWGSRRLHSISAAFPQNCWRLHSTDLGILQLFLTLWKRCEDATLVRQVLDKNNPIPMLPLVKSVNIVCQQTPGIKWYVNKQQVINFINFINLRPS